MTTNINHWVGGRLVEGTSGRTSPVFNPATGEQTGSVALASSDEVNAVVASALRAAVDWKNVSLSRRAAIVFKFRELLAARVDELARMITAEHGKVLADALGEIARGLENVEFATGVPQMMKGGFSEGVSTGVDVYSIRQPLGVVAGITPFNFPVMVPLWMCANAIATGNAFILKPSEKDPSASLFLARLWQEADLPDGVFSVLQGDKEAVDGLVTHVDVSAVSFVGSTPVARYIYETGTKAGKRVQALGGAKNHMVVLPDADVEMAADAAVSAGYGAAGERCMAVSVVVAVGNVADPLVDAIATRIPKLIVGDGAGKGTDMGPLITAEHRDKVAGYVAAGEEAGANVVVDGRSSPHPSTGYFIGATLLDDVRTDMSVYRDEIFGPVLSILRVASFDEAIAVINDNEFGNGTAIFTRDGGAARRFQSEIQVGMIGINLSVPVPVSYYSFGGWKASLFGDAHMYGPEGINFYTRGKVVTSRWPDPTNSTVDLGFPQTR